jgi:hypothetical protein
MSDADPDRDAVASALLAVAAGDRLRAARLA